MRVTILDQGESESSAEEGGSEYQLLAAIGGKEKATGIGREESELRKGSRAPGRARTNLDYLGEEFIQCSYPSALSSTRHISRTATHAHTRRPLGHSGPRTPTSHRLTHDATLGQRSVHSWTWAALGEPSFPGPSSCLQSLPGPRSLPVGAQVQC